MYLFVFIFLLLSILGLYTQVYALQTAKMLAGQKAVAQTMLIWHGAAFKLGRERLASLSLDATGCMFANLPPTLPGIGACGGGSRLDETSVDAAGIKVLPDGYSSDFRWYSVAYTDAAGTTSYMLTIAVPPASGSLTEPITRPAMGYSVSEIWQQIRNNGQAKTSYGMVQNTALGDRFVTPFAPIAPPATTPPAYELPSCGTACLPIGSVGYISTL